MLSFSLFICKSTNKKIRFRYSYKIIGIMFKSTGLTLIISKLVCIIIFKKYEEKNAIVP